jgi:hypothetical protein
MKLKKRICEAIKMCERKAAREALAFVTDPDSEDSSDHRTSSVGYTNAVIALKKVLDGSRLKS